MGGGGGGGGGGGEKFRRLGPGGVSLLGGAQLTLVQYVCLKKQLNPADAFF